jgi:hypothetical protein
VCGKSRPTRYCLYRSDLGRAEDWAAEGAVVSSGGGWGEEWEQPASVHCLESLAGINQPGEAGDAGDAVLAVARVVKSGTLVQLSITASRVTCTPQVVFRPP